MIAASNCKCRRLIISLPAQGKFCCLTQHQSLYCVQAFFSHLYIPITSNLKAHRAARHASIFMTAVHSFK